MKRTMIIALALAGCTPTREQMAEEIKDHITKRAAAESIHNRCRYYAQLVSRLQKMEENQKCLEENRKIAKKNEQDLARIPEDLRKQVILRIQPNFCMFPVHEDHNDLADCLNYGLGEAK